MALDGMEKLGAVWSKIHALRDEINRMESIQSKKVRKTRSKKLALLAKASRQYIGKCYKAVSDLHPGCFRDSVFYFKVMDINYEEDNDMHTCVWFDILQLEFLKGELREINRGCILSIAPLEKHPLDICEEISVGQFADIYVSEINKVRGMLGWE